MKMTLNLDDHLIRTAEIRAARQGDTLTQLIERALRDYLHADTRDSTLRYRAELLTKRGPAVAGVNLDDRDALYGRMDAPD